VSSYVAKSKLYFDEYNLERRTTFHKENTLYVFINTAVASIIEIIFKNWVGTISNNHKRQQLFATLSETFYDIIDDYFWLLNPFYYFINNQGKFIWSFYI
jgi:hypothetical protein